MKVCTKCKVEKCLDSFYIKKSGKNGRDSWCKKCAKDCTTNYRKTKIGLIRSMYSKQKTSSAKRGHPSPSYSINELKEWFFKQEVFEELYSNWVNSNYSTALRPSIDRVDDYKPYTMENIQLTTWRENNMRSHSDRRSGVNKKVSKEVVCIDMKTGSVEVFVSMREAGRKKGILSTHISRRCRKEPRHDEKYSWVLKEDYSEDLLSNFKINGI